MQRPRIYGINCNAWLIVQCVSAAARCPCRQDKHAHLQAELEAAQQQLSGLQQQLHQQQQQCKASGSTAREHAATSSLLQQQLQAVEQKLLDMAQQRGYERQECEQRVAALQEQYKGLVSTGLLGGHRPCAAHCAQPPENVTAQSCKHDTGYLQCCPATYLF